MRIVQQNLGAVAHAPDGVAHLIEPHFVEAELAHLGLDALADRPDERIHRRDGADFFEELDDRVVAGGHFVAEGRYRRLNRLQHVAPCWNKRVCRVVMFRLSNQPHGLGEGSGNVWGIPCLDGSRQTTAILAG